MPALKHLWYRQYEHMILSKEGTSDIQNERNRQTFVFSYYNKNVYQYALNRISGVMVSVLTSSAVHRGVLTSIRSKQRL
jgi:hypothetical protein